ncbi:macro domain-containing protein [Lysobacter sp. MMG2]|uniref:macro domain-containing protein n=1 Tax=Lysobacter sp. MMG2 TaxID=2801338 RepID=UPI001C25053D|nr:macro domain-containing protein [Lysobacter sp. MMG2]MBU8976858.1 macro domain-containing protein [Lysobacter sp. MMG2]
MLKEVEGDLLLTNAQVIAHGIAPEDHFDSGLALALRERWPSMVRDYRHAMRREPLEPGDIWAWSGVDEGGRRIEIVNLLTQDMHRGHAGKASLLNVSHSLKALARHVREEGIRSLALPRLATGVGGLEWVDVRPLVQHLGELGIPVIVYTTYHADVAANEGLSAQRDFSPA